MRNLGIPEYPDYIPGYTAAAASSRRKETLNNKNGTARAITALFNGFACGEPMPPPRRRVLDGDYSRERESL